MSTCFASNFSVRVFCNDSAVMPDVLATVSASPSVLAADGALMLAYDMGKGRDLLSL